MEGLRVLSWDNNVAVGPNANVILPDGYALQDADSNIITSLDYEKTGTIVAHTHTYVSDHNDTRHWETCACGAKKDEAQHTLNTTPSTDGTETHVSACACGYTSAPSAHVFTDVECICCAKAVASVTINDETTYYGTMTGALAACQDGSTLTLLENVTFIPAVLEKAVNFNLNGKTLCQEYSGPDMVIEGDCTVYGDTIMNCYGDAGLQVSENGVLTLRDCTIQGPNNRLTLFGKLVIQENVVLQYTDNVPTSAQIYTDELNNNSIDMSHANQPSYTVYYGYSTPLSSLEVNNAAYEFVHTNGTPVTADNKLKEDEVGIIRLKHQHSWDYTANDADDTITATCNGTVGTCSLSCYGYPAGTC